MMLRSRLLIAIGFAAVCLPLRNLSAQGVPRLREPVRRVRIPATVKSAHCVASLGGPPASGQALQASGACILTMEHVAQSSGPTNVTLINIEAGTGTQAPLTLVSVSGGAAGGARLILTGAIQLSGSPAVGRWTERSTTQSGLAVQLVNASAVEAWTESGPAQSTGTMTLNLTAIAAANGSSVQVSGNGVTNSFGFYNAHGTLTANLVPQSASENGHDLVVNITF